MLMEIDLIQLFVGTYPGWEGDEGPRKWAEYARIWMSKLGASTKRGPRLEIQPPVEQEKKVGRVKNVPARAN